MAFVLTTDPTEFSDQTTPFLEASPECNVLATVLMSVLSGRYRDVQPVFGYQVDARGSITAAPMRTPPAAMLTSRLAPETVDAVLEAWLRLDPALPGVNGPSATARDVAAAWSRRTGGCAQMARAMAMHSLRRVSDPPRPPDGRLRPGTVDERDRLIAWWRAFADEAGGDGATGAEANVDARLRDESIFVWDDGGPVSLVVAQPPVAGVVRIGPVYTPPEHRRHGYAGAAVAEISRWALAAGAHTCMLFTDLDNPTSNKIYFELGYRRFADWEEYRFIPT